MGRPWHIFKVAPDFAVVGGFPCAFLRCLVWAGAIAASSATLVTRKREATSNFISLPPTLILGLGRHYRREPAVHARAGGRLALIHRLRRLHRGKTFNKFNFVDQNA